MSMTRPVEQGVAEIDRRGRIRLPTRLVKAIKWISDDSDTTEALIVLDKPGKIMLLPWGTEGSKIMARQKELIELSDVSEEAIDALRILEDRYKLITIPKDLRPTLRTEILLHIDLPIGTESYVYVMKVFEKLEIFSLEYRKQYLLDRPEALDGLP